MITSVETQLNCMVTTVVHNMCGKQYTHACKYSKEQVAHRPYVSTSTWQSLLLKYVVGG